MLSEENANPVAAVQANPTQPSATKPPTAPAVPPNVQFNTINMRDAPIQLAVDLIGGWTGEKVTFAPSLATLRVCFEAKGLEVADATAGLLAAIMATNPAIHTVTASDGSIQILDWNAPP